jgi:hypothetical protein
LDSARELLQLGEPVVGESAVLVQEGRVAGEGLQVVGQAGLQGGVLGERVWVLALLAEQVAEALRAE